MRTSGKHNFLSVFVAGAGTWRYAHMVRTETEGICYFKIVSEKFRSSKNFDCMVLEFSQWVPPYRRTLAAIMIL